MKITAIAIIAGLLPITWSHGTGADVMKRIAAPMVGGLLTSLLLELTAIYSVRVLLLTSTSLELFLLFAGMIEEEYGDWQKQQKCNCR